jgi:colanic acid/amylovoran biosynthesis glycosyltransferase
MEEVELIVAAPVYINPHFDLKGKKIEIPNPLNFVPSGLLGNLKHKKNLKYIKKWMQQNDKNFDLVHGHFSMVGWEYLEVCKQLQKKICVSFYGFDYEYLPHVEPVWKIRYSEMFDKAHAVICEGAYGKSTLVKNGCPEEKIYIIPLGVNVPDSKPEKSKQASELKLIQMANFKEKKGHIDTLVAFAAALDTCPNMHLTLVGDGELISECREFVDFNNIQNQVTFIPHIPFEKLSELLYTHHVLIQPSKHSKDFDCEGGAPVILLDAMANGLPVISTFHCDIPNIVEDGQTGLLSPERDVLYLQRNIENFYRMENSVYQNFSNQAYKHVLYNFEYKICSHRLEQLYMDLCK